jgi:hypothetical protein
LPPPRPAAEAPVGISTVAATTAKQAITDLSNIIPDPFSDRSIVLENYPNAD